MDDFATGYLAGQDGGNNNGGFFGNEGLWAVIILAIIFGWGTNGYGRNGGAPTKVCGLSSSSLSSSAGALTAMAGTAVTTA